MNTTTETLTQATPDEFHHGTTVFRRQGRKWVFTTPTPDQKQYTFITQFRGGLTIAQRVAQLVNKDVSKIGRLGGQRANINRLVEAAR